MSAVIRICSKEGKENNINLVKCIEVLTTPGQMTITCFPLNICSVTHRNELHKCEMNICKVLVLPRNSEPNKHLKYMMITLLFIVQLRKVACTTAAVVGYGL